MNSGQLILWMYISRLNPDGEVKGLIDRVWSLDEHEANLQISATIGELKRRAPYPYQPRELLILEALKAIFNSNLSEQTARHIVDETYETDNAAVVAFIQAIKGGL